MTPGSFNNADQKVWIFAGETSGDLYGAYLAYALQQMRPDLTIEGMGGQHMADVGVKIIVDSTELGVTGFVEVVKMYPKFKKIFNILLTRARRVRPDVIVFIDYPGFNLRFAEKAKELGIKVVYYVSPQVWAWKKGRAPKIAKLVDHMMVIFPFEEHIYDEYGLPTTFIGHPLVEVYQELEEVERDEDLVLLLPGSRRTEIDRIFPYLYGAGCLLRQKHPRMHFVIPTPRQSVADYIKKRLAKYKKKGADKLPIHVTCGDNEEWMRKAIAGIAASGTVTVQCAILGLPLVSVYRMNPISHFIFARIATLKYFTMVNIITDRLVYEEFAGRKMVPEIISAAVERILPGGERRDEVLDGIDEAIECLGAAVPASQNAAQIVLDQIDQ